MSNDVEMAVRVRLMYVTSSLTSTEAPAVYNAAATRLTSEEADGIS